MDDPLGSSGDPDAVIGLLTVVELDFDDDGTMCIG